MTIIMALSEDFLTELVQKNDIETVIAPYVNLKRAGKLYKGLCPFHNEKTPSFTVYPDTQSYFCFGCSSGGDVITFVKNIENLDYMDAVKFLVQRSGMQMPDDGYDDTIPKRRRRILEANREAAKFFYKTLNSSSGKVALDYYEKRRLSPNTIKHFGLGYAPDSWDSLLKYMTDKGFSISELFDANLIKKSEKNGKSHYYDNFRNRVITPIIDIRGNIIAFGGRVLDDSKPKYINTSDTLVYKKTDNVFAMNFAKNGNPKSMIVCEGYMDVISMHQAGFTNSVASCGTALTSTQARFISRYCEEVILSYDADEAGIEATRKAIKIFSDTGIKIRVLRLTGGKDPDEIIRTYGKEKFKNILNGAENDIEFKILNEQKKYDISTPDGKSNFLFASAQILASCNKIEQDIYSEKLAGELNVSKDAILNEVDKAYKKRNIYKNKHMFDDIIKSSTSVKDVVNPESNKYFRAAKAEEIILESLLFNPGFYDKIKNMITQDSFITSFNKKVYSVISEKLENNESIELAMLASSFDNLEMGRLAHLRASSKQITNTLEECLDCIKVLEQEKQKVLNGTKKGSEMDDDEFRNFFKNKKPKSDV